MPNPMSAVKPPYVEAPQGSHPRFTPIPSRLQMLIERYADAYHRYLKYSAPSEWERESLTKAKTELEHEIRTRLTL